MPPCMTEERSYCVPGPCSSDADCGDTMVCVTNTYEACSGGGTPACKPGQDCPAPEPMAPVIGAAAPNAPVAVTRSVIDNGMLPVKGLLPN